VIPLRDINPTRTRPVVNYALIAVNMLVFAYQFHLQLESPALFKNYTARFGLVPYYLTHDFHFGNLGTLVSSMFMHGDWLHVISNMWFLFIFGDNVEDVLGRVRYIAFYVLCGLCAAFAQIAIDPDSLVPMVGASGAIAGVLGAYFRLFPHARVVTLIPVLFFAVLRELPAVFFIVVWFGLQLLMGLGTLGAASEQTGGVAFFAHIGGFVGGLILLSLFGFGRNRTQGFRRIERDGRGYDSSRPGAARRHESDPHHDWRQ
jgi:membrane associated rhomboid family serine protease